jgi:hypothetical protein
MLQQCSSPISCMRTRIAMEEHYEYSECQHSMPFVLNGHTQFLLASRNTFQRYCGPVLHEFHHQQSFPVPDNSCYQRSGRQRLFKIVQLLWWMCVHQRLWLLFDFNIHKWDSSFITCYSYNVSEKFIAIFVISLYKSKPKPFSAFCAHPWEFSEPILRKTYSPTVMIS